MEECFSKRCCTHDAKESLDLDLPQVCGVTKRDHQRDMTQQGCGGGWTVIIPPVYSLGTEACLKITKHAAFLKQPWLQNMLFWDNTIWLNTATGDSGDMSRYVVKIGDRWSCAKKRSRYLLLSFSPTCIFHTVLKIYLEVPLHNLMWWKRENRSERTNCRVVTDNMRHTADTSTQQIALFADNLYCFWIVWHKMPIHAWCVVSPFSYSSSDLKGKILSDKAKWNKSVRYNRMRFGTNQQCLFL